MPELPEVECVRQSMLPALLGRRIERARLLRHDVLFDGALAGRRRLLGSLVGVGTEESAARALLEGATIDRIERLGKHLALVARDGRVLEVHLGMTGHVGIAPASLVAPAPHLHAHWELEGGLAMTFHDPRRFGGLWACADEGELRTRRWSALGPDALTISTHALRAALGGSARALKAGLLDQRALAGVGNIYADEALFRARVSPRRRCRRVRNAEWDTLAHCVREVLAEGVARGGSTLRDYRDAGGREGTMQERFSVYGRGGEPCTGCGNTLRSALIAQRTTVWCGRCQA